MGKKAANGAQDAGESVPAAKAKVVAAMQERPATTGRRRSRWCCCCCGLRCCLGMSVGFFSGMLTVVALLAAAGGDACDALGRIPARAAEPLVEACRGLSELRRPVEQAVTRVMANPNVDGLVVAITPLQEAARALAAERAEQLWRQACPTAPAAGVSGACKGEAAEIAALRSKLQEAEAAKTEAEARLAAARAVAKTAQAEADQANRRLEELSESARAAPPREPTKVGDATAALAVLDSPALEACDRDPAGASCPNLFDAMRTWKYGISKLSTVLSSSTTDVGNYIQQIASDSDSFLAVPSGAPELKDMYIIAAGNNRQVFEVIRGALESEKRGEPAVTLRTDDATLPPAVRGLLCRPGDCD